MFYNREFKLVHKFLLMMIHYLHDLKNVDLTFIKKVEQIPRQEEFRKIFLTSS